MGKFLASLIALLFGVFFVVLLIGGMFLYSAVTWGYVITKLYVWFVLTQFPDLPQFTWLQFIGFAIFLGALLPKPSTLHIKKEYKDNKDLYISFFLAPWITLLFGYLVHLFC